MEFSNIELTGGFSITKSTVLPLEGCKQLLDAGDPTSYPGTGTTWFDISGSGKNATIPSGGPSFSNSNSGYFSFSGSDNSINLGASLGIGGSQQFSYNAVIYFNGSGNSFQGSTFSYYDTGNGQGFLNDVLFFAENNSGLMYFQINSQSTGDGGSGLVVTPGSWLNICLTFDGTAGNTNADKIKGYLNGVPQTLDFNIYTAPTSMPYQPANAIMGAYALNNDLKMDGRIALHSIYNRILTPEEVLLAFNGIKDRYGL